MGGKDKMQLVLGEKKKGREELNQLYSFHPSSQNGSGGMDSSLQRKKKDLGTTFGQRSTFRNRWVGNKLKVQRN